MGVEMVAARTLNWSLVLNRHPARCQSVYFDFDAFTEKSRRTTLATFR